MDTPKYPNLTTPMTTSDSAASGRLKVATGGKKQSKLMGLIKKVVNRGKKTEGGEVDKSSLTPPSKWGGLGAVVKK